MTPFSKELLNRARMFAIALFICICPIVYSGGDLRFFQERVFQLAAMGIFSLYFGNTLASLFMLLNIFLFWYNYGPVSSTGYSQVLNVFMGCTLFLVSRTFFEKNSIRRYSKLLVWVAIASVVFTILQSLRLDPLTVPVNATGKIMPGANNGGFGLFAINMASGIFLTICLPIVATINIWLTPLWIVPILLSKSSSVALSLVGAILFYTFYMHRRLFWVMLVVIPLLGGFYIYKDMHRDSKTFFSRFPMWHCVLGASLKNPIGYGPDSFRNINGHKDFTFHSDNAYKTIIEVDKGNGQKGLTYYSPTRNEDEVDRLNRQLIEHGFKNNEYNFWDTPHNLYLNILFQYGFLGFGLLCLLVRELIERFKRSIQDKTIVMLASCLLIYAITSLTNFPLELARTACIFPILLGAYYAETDRHEQNDYD